MIAVFFIVTDCLIKILGIQRILDKETLCKVLEEVLKKQRFLNGGHWIMDGNLILVFKLKEFKL